MNKTTNTGSAGVRQRAVRPVPVSDAFAGCIVGRRVIRTALGFVSGAVEQAVQQRQPGSGLVHHSEGGSQYRSIR